MLKFGAALVGVLIILALTSEVTLPVEEGLMDSLLRGLDNERNAFSFHTIILQDLEPVVKIYLLNSWLM
jgi:hypothetical protein